MEYIKALTIGDCHCKLSNIEEVLDVSNKSSKIIKDEKPNIVILLGDLTDGHEKIHLDSLNSVSKFLDIITESSLSVNAKVFYIIGNHDLSNHSLYLSDSHAFNSFKKWNNLTVIDKPKGLKTKFGNVIFCPYVPVGRFEEALDTIGRNNWINAKVIFAHQEFLNANFGSIISKKGDEWNPSNPMVISGHVHTNQHLQNNIYYPGSPYQIGFGEEDDKTISMFMIGEKIEEKRYNLDITKKITIELNTENAFSYEVPNNAKIRINLKGTSQEHSKFCKTEKYKELTSKCKIIPHITDSVEIKENVTRKSYIDILREECLKENKLVSDTLDEVLK